MEILWPNERTSEKGEVYRKIRIECPGVAEEDIELDDAGLMLRN